MNPRMKKILESTPSKREQIAFLAGRILAAKRAKATSK